MSKKWHDNGNRLLSQNLEGYTAINSVDNSINNSIMFQTLKNQQPVYENIMGLTAKSTGIHTNIPAA